MLLVLFIYLFTINISIGTDYINATWLQGHRSLREYIVTQHPLPNTVGDLYRMLWDHSCQIIVMLSNCAYDPVCIGFFFRFKICIVVDVDDNIYDYFIVGMQVVLANREKS